MKPIASPLPTILSPVLTPFNTDGSPNSKILLKQCQWLSKNGVGHAVFGTNSEANSMSATEKLRVLDDLLSGGLDPNHMMPGTGACSVDDAVTMTKAAVKAKCAGVLMLPPFYYKDVSDDGLFAYFAEVIEKVGDSALQIYWNYTQGVSVGGDLTNWISSSVGLQLNVWSHIAVVRSGTIMILYINGVPVGTATNSTNLNNSANVRYIGGMNGTNLYGTFGYISNLRVVKGTAVYGPPSGTGSVSLNGSSQYLTVASNAAFAFGTGDFTTEFWFNVSGAGDSADQHVFQTRDGTNNGILFQYNRTNKTLAFLSDTGLTGLITANNAIVDGTWYHVSATRSGTAIYFFVNGILIASTTSAQNFSGTTPYIGRRYATDGFLHYFNGNISNLRVVKGVAVYTGNFTPSTVPLTSTQLANVNGYPSAAITGTSTSLLLNTVYGAGFLTDSSSYNFTVTNVGTATSQSLTPFVGNFIPPTRQLTSTQLANVNGYPSAEITGTSTSLLLNTPNNSSFLTDSSSYNFTVTNVGTATSQATAPFALSFTPSTVPLQSTQSANQIGNPSAAITGTSTSLLLNTQNGPAYLVDGSTNNFTVTNTGGATKQSSIPFSL
jgi:hypothetical protein